MIARRHDVVAFDNSRAFVNAARDPGTVGRRWMSRGSLSHARLCDTASQESSEN